MKTESLAKPYFGDYVRNIVKPEFVSDLSQKVEIARNKNRNLMRATLTEITEAKEPKLRNLIIKSDGIDLVSVNTLNSKDATLKLNSELDIDLMSNTCNLASGDTTPAI